MSDLSKREEAIQILQLYRDEIRQRLDKVDSPDVKDVYQWQMDGFDMAIEALSAEAVQGDAKMIPIELKKRYPYSRDEDITDAFMRGYQAHAEAVQRWIPVSERLPSESGWYLITVQGCEKVADMEWYYGEWDAWNGVSSEQQVLAWMPLPEPYKGGDSE